MKPVLSRWWLAGAVLAVLAFGAVRVERHFHHQPMLHAGDRLVPLQVSSLSGGPAMLAPSGRPTLINVFATWCPPCREETPGFAAVAPALRARGVDMLAIDQEESAAAVRLFAKDFALPYPVYIDTTGVTHDVLGARIIPTTILVNRQGVIVWEHSGPMTREQLLAAVSQAETHG